MDEHKSEQQGPTVVSDRRTFLKKAAIRSLATVGITAAAAVAVYKKPQLRSFLPGVTVYAQTTGSGKFTLKGTT